MNAPAPEPGPSRNLLTREDLARLEIPPTDVLQWLLAGSLCEAGSLPGEESNIAVFAVPDPELRSELAARLTTIGKPDAVLTRQQARAEVVRAVVAQRHLTPIMTPLVEVTATATESVEVDVLTEDLAGSDVGGDADGSEDSGFFDAEDLVHELDAWAAPAADDIPDEAPGEAPDQAPDQAEGEMETMSTTPDQIDEELSTATTDAENSAVESPVEVAITSEAEPPIEPDTEETSPDDAASLLEDLTDAAEEFDPTATIDDNDDASDAATIDAVAGAAIDDLVEPEIETKAPPTLDLSAFAESPEPATEQITGDDGDPSPANEADTVAAAAAGPISVEPEPEPTMPAPSDGPGDDPAEVETEAVSEGFVEEGSIDREPIEESPIEDHASEEGPEEQALVEETSIPEPSPDEPVATNDPPEEGLLEPEPVLTEAEAETTEAAPSEPPAEPAPEFESPAAESSVEEAESAPPPGDLTSSAATTATAETTTDATMTRVESFLGELRGALVDLAQRPPESAAPVDMQPLVAAVGEFGQRVEHGVAVGVHAAMLNGGQKTESPTPIQYVKTGSSGQEITMLSVAFLVLCWSGILWFKTGNAALAIGTLIGANVIGCCLLARRR